MEQTIGKRIMQNRKRMGLTQDQLAEKLGVTAQAVSKWENDQSCPDISILGTLADIFGISTDALLGRTEDMPVHETEIVEEDESEGIHVQKGDWEFRYESGKRSGIALAVLVLAVGIQLFLGRLWKWDISFWSTLWPTALTVLGLFSILKEFSFLGIGCLLFGGYFMLDNLNYIPFTLGGELVFPAVLVLFGLSLLADAMKKPDKHRFHFHSKNKQKNDFVVDGETLEYSASFGEHAQDVIMDRLTAGRINCSFGDYDIDLTGVKSVSEDCALQVNCSFGDVTLIVPRRFAVKQFNSTSFGEISVSGHADPVPEGTIHLKANASFGEITVEYK